MWEYIALEVYIVSHLSICHNYAFWTVAENVALQTIFSEL